MVAPKIESAALEERIAARAAEIVIARLARVVTTEPTHYLTRKGHAPAGWNDEAWKVAAPTIPGAHKPGRWWVVSCRDYEAWARARSNAPSTPVPVANASAAWSPDSVIAALGLRSSR